MKRDEVIARLRGHRPELETLGIDHLRVFGSVARDEATSASDVDLVAEFNPTARVGFAIVGIHRRLEEILECKVDLIRAPVRQTNLQRRIDSEGIYAF